MRYFNTEGLCRPEEHYMVRLDDRLAQIRELYVDRKKYFVINKGRQYGKTTTLRALAKYLKDKYLIFSLDFQQMGTKTFADETTFSRGFLDRMLSELRKADTKDKVKMREMLSDFKDNHPDVILDGLFAFLSSMCESCERPIILIIDEVDSASNNQVFIDFLAQLRGYYLRREDTPTFHSVILAGVYDIKNLKLKLRSESEHQYNSPWNIAADFDIEMSFSISQIVDMLGEYESDHQTGMDILEAAEKIYQYTAGYPVLVSAICQKIDEKISKEETFGDLERAWTFKGIEESVRRILTDRTPLFESMIRHLDDYPEMKRMFHEILFQGKTFSYNLDTKEISLASMFGYVVNKGGKVQVANRIFETRLYNYFLSENELAGTDS